MIDAFTYCWSCVTVYYQYHFAPVLFCPGLQFQHFFPAQKMMQTAATKNSSKCFCFLVSAPDHAGIVYAHSYSRLAIDPRKHPPILRPPISSVFGASTLSVLIYCPAAHYKAAFANCCRKRRLSPNLATVAPNSATVTEIVASVDRALEVNACGHGPMASLLITHTESDWGCFRGSAICSSLGAPF